MHFDYFGRNMPHLDGWKELRRAERRSRRKRLASEILETVTIIFWSVIIGGAAAYIVLQYTNFGKRVVIPNISDRAMLIPELSEGETLKRQRQRSLDSLKLRLMIEEQKCNYSNNRCV